MHNNGTMFVHVFLAPAEEGKGVENPFDAAWMVNQTGELTTCHVDQATALQVTSDNPVEKVNATSLCCLCYSVSSSMAAAGI